MKLLALLFSLSSALFVTVLPRREECFHETGKAGDKVSLLLFKSYIGGPYQTENVFYLGQLKTFLSWTTSNSFFSKRTPSG